MRIIFSIDVEAHRVIDEITGPTKDSLGTILRILQEEQKTATFFVDVCEVSKWGRDFMRLTCKRILGGGHELQLHVHPHHASLDNSRWLLSEYSREEQERILSQAIADFEDVAGCSPTAFRAGGFGADDSTLDILAEMGVLIDSSYLWRRPGCVLTPGNISEASKYRNVVEVPLTPAVVLGSKTSPIRTSCLDFNWLPVFVIKRLLLQMQRNGQSRAVLLMHSSSMYVRVGATRLWYRSANERRLREILKFADENRIPVCTLSSAAEVISAEPEPSVAVLKGIVSQYIVLLYQAIIGFGISRKFRAFVAINVLGAAAVCYGLIWFFR